MAIIDRWSVFHHPLNIQHFQRQHELSSRRTKRRTERCFSGYAAYSIYWPNRYSSRPVAHRLSQWRAHCRSLEVTVRSSPLERQIRKYVRLSRLLYLGRPHSNLAVIPARTESLVQRWAWCWAHPVLLASNRRPSRRPLDVANWHVWYFHWRMERRIEWSYSRHSWPTALDTRQLLCTDSNHRRRRSLPAWSNVEVRPERDTAKHREHSIDWFVLADGSVLVPREIESVDSFSIRSCRLLLVEVIEVHILHRRHSTRIQCLATLFHLGKISSHPSWSVKERPPDHILNWRQVTYGE